MEQSTHESNTTPSSTSRVLAVVQDRLDAFPPWVLLIQAFVGLGWLRAGVEKVIMIMQFAIGAALLLGRRLGVALGAGMFLNLHFVAAGAVTPSVFYLLAQGAVVLWLAEQSARRDPTRMYDVALLGGATLTAGLALDLRRRHDHDEPVTVHRQMAAKAN